jgi:hypothetical protein
LRPIESIAEQLLVTTVQSLKAQGEGSLGAGFVVAVAGNIMLMPRAAKPSLSARYRRRCRRKYPWRLTPELAGMVGAGALEERGYAVFNRHALRAAVEQVKLVAHLVGCQLFFLCRGNSRCTAIE